jgi:deoxyribodipyrimidine photo-lyase
MKRALVWFRNDLRIHDNETVTKAIEENDQVLFLYIKQPEQIHPQCSDIAVPYQYRNVFIDECLIDLNEQLQDRKAKLTVAEGEPISIISDLIEHLRIERVYISAEYADYELLQEYPLEQIIPLHRYHTSTLIHPAQLPFGIAELPDVFTNFRH